MPAGSALQQAHANSTPQQQEKTRSLLSMALNIAQNLLRRIRQTPPPQQSKTSTPMKAVKNEFGNEPVGSGCHPCDVEAASNKIQPPPKLDPNSPEWLKVPRGQLTFDVEGDGDETLIPHWPGDNSGVTIGRGLDLGTTSLSKQQIEALLRNIEVPQRDIDLLLSATGKRGAEAQSYATEIKEKVKITRMQQNQIFQIVYDIYAIDAENYWAHYLGNKNIKNDRPHTWSELDPTIQEILIDFKYRGDWTVPHLTIIKPGYDNNSLSKLLIGLENEDYWSKNTNMESRSTKRADYVRRKIVK